jgi:hypothetical protein
VAQVPALRASDADRERVVALLRDHHAAGRLTLDEFTSRIGAAYAARTLDELEPLTEDLPGAAPAVRTRRGGHLVVAVMSGATRRGRWRVPAETTVIALMGGCKLDLREAVIEEPEVRIDIFACMGGVEIVVPDGVDVELTGIAIMGGKEHSGGRPAPPGAPVVHVRAFALMSGVHVQTKALRHAAAGGGHDARPLSR